MKTTLLFILSMAFMFTNAQIITTIPAFPTENDAVTITFDAAEGNQGLMDYTGDIYAHTGVITSESSGGSDWKYVKTSWGENTPATKLTRVEPNLYTLEIGPSIKEYYGVPDGEKVLQMAFVFRSHDNTQEAKTADNGDIYADVYEANLNVSLISPEKDVLVTLNQEINIEAAASFADSLFIYIDGNQIAATNEESLSASHTVAEEGKHWIIAIAKDAENSVYDSISYFVREEVTVEDMPIGTRKGINYIDDNTATLVLHAPEKEFVYLEGDFNGWDISNLEPTMAEVQAGQVSATSWMMNKTSDGSHFWLTINGLIPEKEYRYQYFVDGEISIADPYADKILDPWNDKYISESTYPNLIEFPEGEASEPVSVFQTAQGEYQWQVTDFTPPAVTDMVVYEMLIRDFVEAHDYKTIADTLNYLKKLGVNVLELMPINEFEGNSSWGYNPSFYFAPDKYYGPKEDLKMLVDECHKNGIAVVIDMVLNHSYGQSPFVRLYLENGKPAPNNPWYNVDNNFTNPDAHWGYDFNHESVHTQNLVDSINAYWMEVYNVDGFRFDFTKGFGNNIKDNSDPWGSIYDADRIRLLKRMSDEIWDRNNDAYVIFEHLAENSEEKVLAEYGILLWGNLNHSYLQGAMGYNDNGESDFSWISYQKRGWNQPNVVGYMESHDEERMMYKNLTWGDANGSYNVKNLNTALSRCELAASFFLTIPGPKMIWQFGELGYDFSIDYNGRVGEKPIRWDYYDDSHRKRLYDVYGALARLRTEEPAFETTDYDLSVYGATKTIHLNHTDMNVIVLGNFDLTEQTINPEFQETGWWYNYFTGDSIDVTDVNAELTLAAGEYAIYTTKRLAVPEITTSIEEQKGNLSGNGLIVYPNPASELIILKLNQEIKHIAVYSITGQKLKEISNSSSNEIAIADLKTGIYIISVTDNTGKKHVTRFIKE